MAPVAIVLGGFAGMVPRHPSVRLLAAALVACCLTAACSGDDDPNRGLDIDTTSPPLTTATTAPPTTVDPRIADAEAGFEDFWQMQVRLSRRPNPNDQEI